MVDRTDKLAIGDRMKSYERIETDRRFSNTKPVYARIDGRSFSKFTKGMKRPYDIDMSQAMIETTKYLVQETNASIGYCQSDEISLVWFADDDKSKVFFNGRIQKMASNIASLATAAFLMQAIKNWPEKCAHRLPSFDCRVIEMPSLEEAANMILWREIDATKNSISMAAHHYYSHKSLHKKTGEEKVSMLKEKGIVWDDYPAFFKRGTFIRSESYLTELTAEDLAKVPDAYKELNKTVTRNRIVEVDMPAFREVTNRVGVIFYGEKPLIVEQHEVEAT